MSADVAIPERRTRRIRHRTVAIGLLSLTAGMLLAAGIASDTQLRNSFAEATATRLLPTRAHDPRLTSGFDVAALHLGRHDGAADAAIKPAAIRAGRAFDGDLHSDLSVLDGLTQAPLAGQRILLSAADGRSEMLEVVATAPLPSGFDDRAGTGETDGASNPAFDRGRSSAPALLLVTLKSVTAGGIAGGPAATRLVRMIIDVPSAAVTAPVVVVPRPKAL